MVSKSPLRNPLEMFWKPKESSNCGKVCKNEEKMETFTNNASRMTLDPKILQRGITKINFLMLFSSRKNISVSILPSRE